MMMSVTAKLSILEVSGVALILFAICCLIGHYLGFHTLADWGTHSDMAPPTAVCFILVGGSKFALASALKQILKKP